MLPMDVPLVTGSPMGTKEASTTTLGSTLSTRVLARAQSCILVFSVLLLLATPATIFQLLSLNPSSMPGMEQHNSEEL